MYRCVYVCTGYVCTLFCVFGLAGIYTWYTNTRYQVYIYVFLSRGVGMIRMCLRPMPMCRVFVGVFVGLDTLSTQQYLFQQSRKCINYCNLLVLNTTDNLNSPLFVRPNADNLAPPPLPLVSFSASVYRNTRSGIYSSAKRTSAVRSTTSIWTVTPR